MPNFAIEVTSKTLYGPFNYQSEQALQNDLVAGSLDISSRMMVEGGGTVIKVKEIKEPVQGSLLPKEA
jgi:hypothetical protein